MNFTQYSCDEIKEIIGLRYNVTPNVVQRFQGNGYKNFSTAAAVAYDKFFIWDPSLSAPKEGFLDYLPTSPLYYGNLVIQFWNSSNGTNGAGVKFLCSVPNITKIDLPDSINTGFVELAYFDAAIDPMPTKHTGKVLTPENRFMGFLFEGIEMEQIIPAGQSSFFYFNIAFDGYRLFFR